MVSLSVGVKTEYEPNSAGGVSIEGSVLYWADIDKGVRKITITFVPYDSKLCGFDYRLEYEMEIYVHSNGRYYFKEKNIWYNNTISSAEATVAWIEFEDGTKERIDDIGIEPFPSKSKSSGGCYVATAVYGSYDCPQVWTLRRYRDYTLAETWYGRAFVHTYYAISPTLVKWFGHTEWFKKMWKGKLDRMVKNLQNKGVASTPYKDRNW